MPVLVVVGLELAQCVEQVGLVPDQGPVKKFVPAGLHPSFGDRVHPRNADAREDDLDAFGLDDGVERAGVFAITVPDQVFERSADRTWRAEGADSAVEGRGEQIGGLRGIVGARGPAAAPQVRPGVGG